MAKVEIEKAAEAPENKAIVIPYVNEQGISKDYILEFTRKGVKHAEAEGFRIDDLDSMPVSTIPFFFYLAFWVHHPLIKRETTDKIFYAQSGRMQLIKALADMFGETRNSLFDEEENEENFTWKKTNW